MSPRGSVREFSISSDVNCLVGLEGGEEFHHKKIWVLFIGFGLKIKKKTIDTSSQQKKVAPWPKLSMGTFRKIIINILDECCINFFFIYQAVISKERKKHGKQEQGPSLPIQLWPACDPVKRLKPCFPGGGSCCTCSQASYLVVAARFLLTWCTLIKIEIRLIPNLSIGSSIYQLWCVCNRSQCVQCLYALAASGHPSAPGLGVTLAASGSLIHTPELYCIVSYSAVCALLYYMVQICSLCTIQYYMVNCTLR